MLFPDDCVIGAGDDPTYARTSDTGTSDFTWTLKYMYGPDVALVIDIDMLLSWPGLRTDMVVFTVADAPRESVTVSLIWYVPGDEKYTAALLPEYDVPFTSQEYRIDDESGSDTVAFRFRRVLTGIWEGGENDIDGVAGIILTVNVSEYVWFPYWNVAMTVFSSLYTGN